RLPPDPARAVDGGLLPHDRHRDAGGPRQRAERSGGEAAHDRARPHGRGTLGVRRVGRRRGDRARRDRGRVGGEEEAKDDRVAARASDEEAEKKIRLAGADRVVTPYTIAGRVMANLLIKPQVTAFLNVVSSAGGDLSIEQIEVRRGSGQAGKSLGELRVQERT